MFNSGLTVSTNGVVMSVVTGMKSAIGLNGSFLKRCGGVAKLALPSAIASKHRESREVRLNEIVRVRPACLWRADGPSAHRERPPLSAAQAPFQGRRGDAHLCRASGRLGGDRPPRL